MIKAGDKIGEISYSLNKEEIGRVGIYATEDVEKISFFEILRRVTSRFLLASPA